MAEVDDLTRLYRGLRQRELVRQDAAGLRALEARLAATLERGAAGLVPPIDDVPLESTPPRRVAVALALALYSQAHLARTFAGGGTPIVYDVEVLQEALGLSPWELDELQEDVDRRARSVLRQRAVVRWIEQHLSPERAFRQLFPGLEVEGTVRFRGARLVGEAVLPSLTPSALHLPWLCSTGCGPLDGFRGRYVDGHLRAALVRGLGVPPDAVDAVLERTVVLLPSQQVELLEQADGWRSLGYAALTEVGASYTTHDDLVRPADGHASRWREWLAPPGTSMPGPDVAFDRLFGARLHAVLRAVSADVLARRHAFPARRVDLLDTVDLTSHLEAVQAPLLAWSTDRGSVVDVARSGGISLEAAGALLEEVARVWKERAVHRARPPVRGYAGTPQASWMERVLRLDEALRVLGSRPPIGPDHRQVLFLFAGHFLAEQPVERGLLHSVEDGGSVAQAVAQWFWPTWRRLVEQGEVEDNPTYPGFEVPDGLF